MRPEFRGATEFEVEGEEGSFFWANCEVPDCKNQVCIRLSHHFCFPHHKLLENPDAS